MERDKRVIVINLIGGPGAGKSTTMAGIFYELKRRGINCEMTPEYVKDKVYDESFRVMDDQIYVFAKQLHKLWRLMDKVDVIITDGSLLNSVVYDKTNSNSFRNLVLNEFYKFDNYTYFIDRVNWQYNNDGRGETLAESIQLDEKYIKLMDNEKIPYKRLSNSIAVEEIVKDIIGRLKEDGNEIRED